MDQKQKVKFAKSYFDRSNCVVLPMKANAWNANGFDVLLLEEEKIMTTNIEGQNYTFW